MNTLAATSAIDDNDIFQQDYRTSPKPTGKKYTSVSDLMAGEGTPSEVQESFNNLESETRLVQKLTLARHSAGLTQAEMAAKLEVTQSAISKIECGRDEDLTLAEIMGYAKATGERINLSFGKRPNHVEAIKFHARKMQEYLSALAALAQKESELESSIQAFFGEAFFKILTILSQCQGEIPNASTFEVGMEISKNQPRKSETLPATKTKPKSKKAKIAAVSSK